MAAQAYGFARDQELPGDEQQLLRLWRLWSRRRQQAFLRFMLETSTTGNWEEMFPDKTSPENPTS
jgi:hypothetical protein